MQIIFLGCFVLSGSREMEWQRREVVELEKGFINFSFCGFKDEIYFSMFVC